ncbi:MAG: DNA alkylation repair protein [Elusimicrobia bacterium RIFOXYC2_FULL_34_12]|nr:MAG: DNA alkylation repair protein [Elusimicrobia bacterium RIFOXYC2_FULL_34_12]
MKCLNEKMLEIIDELKSLKNPRNIKGMARFGIVSKNTLGISIYILRDIAKGIGKDHLLAQQLWSSGIFEAKILASMVDEPEKVTEKQMEIWVKDFDSWGVCDQVCDNLFEFTKFNYKKIAEWTSRKEEFVKRAGFTIIACLAVHDKEAKNEKFIKLLATIKREAKDERNYVRKAVNWALRNIGKRNLHLNKEAIKTAIEIQKIDSKSARWIAADALRELKSAPVQKRLKNK